MSEKAKVVVLGGGPVGIEAALYARKRGHEVELFERGEVASHVRRWSHVRMFSPWSLNISSWGRATLQSQGLPVPNEQAFPTGAELISAYLEPLVRSPELEGCVHTGVEVVAVGRRGALKGEFIGTPTRGGRFLLHLRDRGGVERMSEADVLIDATGVYGQPLWAGPGGLPALGELRLNGQLDRYIPDVLGDARARYAGKRTLLLGAGHSAATTLRALWDLRAETPETEIIWVLRGEHAPYEVLADDPLPQREALNRFGNEVAEGARAGVEVHRGAVIEAFSQTGERVRVRLSDGAEVEVDQVIANVGYRPDTALTRELQVHHCYASEGPMKLAASLLAAGGAGGDCLQQSSPGAEVLTSPEPQFFVLGHKSYGRNSAFLLKLGHEQITQIAELLEGA